MVHRTLIGVSQENSADSNPAHHSNAAKTQAALITLQMRPPPQPESSLKKTAKAMKPANQKSAVKASTPRRMNLCAKRGMNLGTAMRKMSARIVNMDWICVLVSVQSCDLMIFKTILTVNIKKLISLGESTLSSKTS